MDMYPAIYQEEVSRVWNETAGANNGLVSVDYALRDLDGNGVYGEKDKDEVGAWIIANSWGDGWEDNGFVYCPYRCCTPKTNNSGWNVKRHFIRKDYEPQRMIKLKLAFSRRSALQLSVGVAQDTAATQADYTMTMHHFNYAGDGLRDTYQPPLVPMLGKWIDGYHYEPMEFGYDLTDMTNIYDRHKPLKYFFTIRTQRNLPEEWQGTGRLYEASVIDYEFKRCVSTPYMVFGTVVESSPFACLCLYAFSADVGKSFFEQSLIRFPALVYLFIEPAHRSPLLVRDKLRI